MSPEICILTVKQGTGLELILDGVGQFVIREGHILQIQPRHSSSRRNLVVEVEVAGLGAVGAFSSF